MLIKVNKKLNTCIAQNEGINYNETKLEQLSEANKGEEDEHSAMGSANIAVFLEFDRRDLHGI